MSYERLSADQLERVRRTAAEVDDGGSAQPSWWMIGGLLVELDAARVRAEAAEARLCKLRGECCHYGDTEVEPPAVCTEEDA